MKKFPELMTPDNISFINDAKTRRKLCYIRRYIYESILSENFSIPENCGINLQNIEMGHLAEPTFKIDNKLIDIIVQELKQLGWEVTLTYGGTMLFVYTKDNKPIEAVNCNSF